MLSEVEDGEGCRQSPGRKRILAYFEGHRTLLFVPETKSGGGQFALAFPTQNSGDLSPVPRDLRPWSLG